MIFFSYFCVIAEHFFKFKFYIMKLIQLFFVAVLCSFLFACEDDTPTPSDNTNDTTVTNHQLVGTWNLTAIEYQGTISSEAVGFPISVSSFTGTGVDMDLTIDFTENPNDYTTSGDYSVLISVESFGQIIEQTWANQGFIDDGTWAEANNVLTVTNAIGGEQSINIIELTDTNVTVTWDYADVTVLAGVTTTQNVEGTYTFMKQ